MDLDVLHEYIGYQPEVDFFKDAYSNCTLRDFEPTYVDTVCYETCGQGARTTRRGGAEVAHTVGATRCSLRDHGVIL